MAPDPNDERFTRLEAQLDDLAIRTSVILWWIEQLICNVLANRPLAEAEEFLAAMSQLPDIAVTEEGASPARPDHAAAFQAHSVGLAGKILDHIWALHAA